MKAKDKHVCTLCTWQSSSLCWQSLGYLLSSLCQAHHCFVASKSASYRHHHAIVTYQLSKGELVATPTYWRHSCKAISHYSGNVFGFHFSKTANTSAGPRKTILGAVTHRGCCDYSIAVASERETTSFLSILVFKSPTHPRNRTLAAVKSDLYVNCAPLSSPRRDNSSSGRNNIGKHPT